MGVFLFNCYLAILSRNSNSHFLLNREESGDKTALTSYNHDFDVVTKRALEERKES